MPNKEVFDVLRAYYYEYPHLMSNRMMNEVKISSFGSKELVEAIKVLKVVEVDDFESFYSYINWDHFLIFKVKNDYYFCDTELAPVYNEGSLLKILDYNLYLRKDKIDKLSK
jgi:hypothetical protein